LTILGAILIVIMVAAAGATSVFKDLLNAVIACAAVSLIASVLFYMLDAPDVAMAEAAIGAGLTTAIFVLAIGKTERYER
jgi:multicomponent Na+:H+ antiporter subunit A